MVLIRFRGAVANPEAVYVLNPTDDIVLEECNLSSILENPFVDNAADLSDAPKI